MEQNVLTNDEDSQQMTMKTKILFKIQELNNHNRAELMILCRDRHIHTIKTDRKNDLIAKLLRNEFKTLRVR